MNDDELRRTLEQMLRLGERIAALEETLGDLGQDLSVGDEDEEEDEWTQQLLAEHPELTGVYLSPGDHRGAWSFFYQPDSQDRDRVLAALRRALTQRPEGARVGDVMRELWGEDASPEEASIVGNTLFRLYRKGLVSRSEKACPSRLWTLPRVATEASDDA